MGERLVLALLAGTAGVLLGLFAPSILPIARDIRQAEQTFLEAPPPPPAPTPFTLPTARPIVQATVPPTLVAAPTPTPDPTPKVRTWVIPLEGGGEMRVLATDEEAARNNVKSSGAVPAD